MRTADSLLRSRAADWAELENLVRKARGQRGRRLSPREIDRLGILYRRLVSDLAGARRDFPEDRVTRFLEGLGARAHAVVFRGRTPVLRDLAGLLLVDFPRAVRCLRAEILVASIAFFGVGLCVFAASLLFPDVLSPYVGDATMDRIRDVGSAVRESGTSPWVDIPSMNRPLASYQIALNNIKVALYAFAGGALLGLFTLHVLAVNGLHLGLTAAFCVHEDAIVPLATFVAAHGVLELTVIVLAGAAGLSIGRAWIDPKDQTRLAATVEVARRAVTVAIGGSVALLVAGLLEGLVSPERFLPPWSKALIGFGIGAAFWAFLCLAGRKAERVDASSTARGEPSW